MFEFLTQKISSILGSIGSQKTLTKQSLTTIINQVKHALLQADVPYEIVEKFTEEIEAKAIGQQLITSLKPAEQFAQVVKEAMLSFMGNPSSQLEMLNNISTILLVGLQGSGKTTTAAKLAHYFHKEFKRLNKKKSILVASVDFSRPAAIEQLKVMADKAEVNFFRPRATHVITAVEEIVSYKIKNGYDLLILDTAGRMHVDETLLDEIKQVRGVLRPDYTLLVLDAMTGQESLNVARTFDQAVNFDASILTKCDSDTRSGAILAFRYALKKLVLFIGTGEKVEDFSVFHPDRAVGRILGQGDLTTLIEKADEKIKKIDQERFLNQMSSGEFTLAHFAEQMNAMSSLGSLGSIVSYLPGMRGPQISPEMLEKGDKELKIFKAIINSMTPKERTLIVSIDSSRRRRIAKGAGVTTQDVSILLDRFKQMQQYVKMFKKSGLLKSLFR